MKKTVIILTILALLAVKLNAQIIQGNYAIKNVQSGMLLRIKDANSATGTPIVAYYPENWKCMTWDFKHVEGNTYQLRNLFSNKTLQPVSFPAPDVPLNEQPIAIANDAQLYEFEDAGSNNTYRIKLKGTDLYLTPADKDGRVNTQIILAARTEEKYQEWSIYEQSPTM